MKSKFAKFVDRTLGAELVFLAAAAIFGYFTAPSVSLFAAGSVTACLYLMFGFSDKRRGEKAEISKAAESMFYAFMFKPDNAPAKLLSEGLKQKGVDSRVRGDALYTRSTAAFFAFDKPADQKTTARMIARAKHYGLKKVTIFCKDKPLTVDVNGFEIRTVCGDDVYRLFASLDVLPKSDFEKHKKSFKLISALSPDRIPRYAMLSAALFGISAFNGFSPVTVFCAALSLALFIASVVATAVKAAKSRSN